MAVPPGEQVPPQLCPFILPNANTETCGAHISTGAFGSVDREKREVDALGKKFHDALVTSGEEASHRIIHKHYNEYILFSTLHHPNIVQFLGIWFTLSSRLPMLVMELMEYSLHDFVESHPSVPLSIKHSIVKDVAQGLHYLHSQTPSIVHRNLSAANILLNASLTSRIADFGAATTLHGPDQKFTPLPGAREYMPPEAFADDMVEYDSKLDIFSFGVVVLFVIANEFPADILSATYTDEKEVLHSRSELERRSRYIEVAERNLGDCTHILLALMGECLNNKPACRPDTTEVLKRLEEFRIGAEGDEVQMNGLQLMEQLQMVQSDTQVLEEYQELLKVEMIVKDQQMTQTFQQKEQAITSTVPIRGADIIAKTTLEVVAGKRLTYKWKGHGLKLYIPSGALKPGTPTSTMSIQASLNGQYQLPDDVELVSGVYWVAFPQKFTKPVTVELEHCADLDYPNELSFITAKCNQQTLPYQFRLLPGGVFSTNTSYGAIEMYHFSAVGVVMKKRKRKRYTAQVFYIPHTNVTTWLMHFTIICNLELCLKMVKIEYSDKGAEVGPYLEVIFDGDEVSLDIPKCGIELPSGWRIQPLVYPTKLLRKSIDTYQPGHPIPACQVQLVWSKVEEHPEELSCMIHVTGVIPHDTCIRVTRHPVFHGAEKSYAVTKTVEASNVEERSGIGYEDTSWSTGEKRLDGDSLRDLMKILYSTQVPGNWMFFGVMLKIPLSSLNTIAAKHPQQPANCLIDVLELWLKRMVPLPSWEALIEALQILGEEKVASELRKCYHVQ